MWFSFFPSKLCQLAIMEGVKYEGLFFLLEYITQPNSFCIAHRMNIFLDLNMCEIGDS